MNQEEDETLDLSAALMRERVLAALVGARPDPVRIGRFELLRACGRGGEGMVYEAYDRAAQTRVALKCLHSVRARDHAALQREFRALSHILHPSLVAMHELFCVDEAWFFTMALIRGVDIVEHVHAQPDRELATRATLRQLLSALSAVHRAGFVHRDVKPSNVLVEPSGRLVLVDFGLVISLASASSVRGGAGTPAYMAPEQLAGGAATPAADLYGVGAILFELLTGASFDSGASRPHPHGGSPELDALCRDLLAEEPAGRPSAEQALARLAQPSPSTTLALPARAAACFVARTRELARLHQALREVAHGGPQIVLVHGESGLGKSALLAQFVAQLAESSLLVLRGRCYERESTPYKVFDEVVADLARELERRPDRRALTRGLLPALGQLFPGLEPNRPRALREPAFDEQARQRAFAALRELLVRLALHAPVLLSIDDLQWGDVDSVALLETLFAPQPGLALLMVGSYRRDEAETSPFLKALLRPRVLAPALCPLTLLALPALTPHEARALVAELSPSPVHDSYFESARGVPFLLVEAALAEPDLVSPDGEHGDVGQLIAARLDGSSASAQELLWLLAVAGRPLPVALATLAAGTPGCSFETALELSARRLVRFRDLDGQTCLEPYHDRVRELYAARLSPAHTRSLHLAIVEAMEQSGRDEPLRRVAHLRAAGERARAAELAARAAELACAQLAWSHAADLQAAALELSAHELPDERLADRLADVLAYAGRHAESAAVYLRAAQRTEGSKRSELERQAARQYMRAGYTRAGLSLFERALSAVGRELPRSQLRATLRLAQPRVQALLRRSLAARWPRWLPRRTAQPARLVALETAYRELWLSFPVQSALAHAHYCCEAVDAGPRERIQALTCEVVVLALADGPRARGPGGRLLREATQLAAERDEPYETALLLFARGALAILARFRPLAAIAPLRRAELLLRTRCPGTQFEQAWVALALDDALETTGQLAALAETVRAREQLELTGLTRALRVASVPLVLLLEDRPADALALAEAHRQASRETLPLLDWLSSMRGASALLYAGEPLEAERYLVDARRRQGFQLALCSRAVRDGERLLRARIACAAYWCTREPRYRRKLEQLSARAHKLPELARAQFVLLEASAARADRRDAECRALLASAGEALALAASEHGVWCARYREAQLSGSATMFAEAQQWFREQGVVAPERWVSLAIPGAERW